MDDKKEDIKDLKIKYLENVLSNLELTAITYDYEVMLKMIIKYKDGYRKKFKGE